MTKLLNAYAADRSAKSAARVVAYLRRHPMAECMLDAAELALLREARAQI